MNKILNEKLGFLKSSRFWQLVIVGVLQALVAVGVIDPGAGEVIANLITTVLVASVGIRTVDRFAEHVGGN